MDGLVLLLDCYYCDVKLLQDRPQVLSWPLFYFSHHTIPIRLHQKVIEKQESRDVVDIIGILISV
jgi:hypothetical protein